MPPARYYYGWNVVATAMLFQAFLFLRVPGDLHVDGDFDLADHGIRRLWVQGDLVVDGTFNSLTGNLEVTGDVTGDGDINLDTPKPEFLSWRWLPPGELTDLIVPFKRALYRDVLAEFAGLLRR